MVEWWRKYSSEDTSTRLRYCAHPCNWRDEWITPHRKWLQWEFRVRQAKIERAYETICENDQGKRGCNDLLADARHENCHWSKSRGGSQPYKLQSQIKLDRVACYGGGQWKFAWTNRRGRWNRDNWRGQFQWQSVERKWYAIGQCWGR